MLLLRESQIILIEAKLLYFLAMKQKSPTMMHANASNDLCATFSRTILQKKVFVSSRLLVATLS